MTKESCGKSVTCAERPGPLHGPGQVACQSQEREPPSGEEIAFANRHATMAEDVIGRSDVEEEVGQRSVEEIALAGNRPLLTTDLHRHLAIVAAGEVFWCEGLEVLQRLADAGLELGEGILLVRPDRR